MPRLVLELSLSRRLIGALIFIYLMLFLSVCFWPLPAVYKGLLIFFGSGLFVVGSVQMCVQSLRYIQRLHFEQEQWLGIHRYSQQSYLLKLLPGSRMLGPMVVLSFTVSHPVSPEEQEQEAATAVSLPRRLHYVLLADSMPRTQWAALRRWIQLAPQQLLGHRD